MNDPRTVAPAMTYDGGDGADGCGGDDGGEDVGWRGSTGSMWRGATLSIERSDWLYAGTRHWDVR